LILSFDTIKGREIFLGEIQTVVELMTRFGYIIRVVFVFEYEGENDG
jgi:hypothetical protein